METPMVGSGPSDESLDLQKVADNSSENAQPAADIKKRPATTEESVERKITTYLLNPSNKDGKTKAKWFKLALGFTQGNAKKLAEQVIFDPSAAVEIGMKPYGMELR